MLPYAQARLVEFLRNEDGPTPVEYALGLALFIVVFLVSIAALGAKAKTPQKPLRPQWRERVDKALTPTQGRPGRGK